MRRSLCILALAFMVQLTYAVPAKGGLSQILQADGSVLTIERHGDEFFHYTTTSDGYQIVQHADNFYYYFQNSATRSLAAVRASDPSERTASERQYLSSISRGVDAQFRARSINAGAERMATSAGTKSVRQILSGANTRASTFAPKGLVIVVEFSDVKLQSKHTKTSFANLLNQKGYSANGGTGSAKDYFEENSNGRYSPTFDIGAIVTLTNSMSYYGTNDADGADSKARQLVIDACRAADGQVRFSDYDTDGDGKVDNVFIYYAGYNEAEDGPENSIWPHRWTIPALSLDGVQIFDYACTSELRGNTGTTMAGIGTFTHEFSHVLGLPDLYDTNDQTGGRSPGMYAVSIMANGSYNNDGCTPPYYSGLERAMLKWAELKPLTNGIHSIEPINVANDALFIPTSSEDEFYVIESRSNLGWDKHLGGYGLMIYHIDQSTNMRGSMKAIDRWLNNKINAQLGAECAKLIESNGGAWADTYNAMGLLFPGLSGKSQFLASDYGGTDNSGIPIRFDITSIKAAPTGVTTIEVRSALATVAITGSVASGGVPVIGATVSLTLPQSAVASRGGSTSIGKSPYRASAAANTLTATTNANGEFTIDGVAQGDYIIYIEKQGYDVMVDNITASGTWQSRQFELTALPSRLCEGISWMRGPVDYLLQTAQPPRISVLWQEQDLASIRGDIISAIKVFTGNSTSLKAVVRLSNGNIVFQKDVTATTPNGITTIRIPEGQLTVPADGDLRVELIFASNVLFIGADSGPVEDGKGDLIWDDTKKAWVSFGQNLNFAVTLEKYKRGDDLATPQLTPIKTKQRDLAFALRSPDSNIEKWIVRYKAADGNWSEGIVAATSFATTIVMAKLTPQTQYQFEIQSVFAGKPSPVSVATISTLPLTAPFPAMDDIVSIFSVGDTYTPALTNLQQEPKSVVWSIDGKVTTDSIFEFTAVGRFSISCTITYPDLSKETITRAIKVQ